MKGLSVASTSSHALHAETLVGNAVGYFASFGERLPPRRCKAHSCRLGDAPPSEPKKALHQPDPRRTLKLNVLRSAPPRSTGNELLRDIGYQSFPIFAMLWQHTTRTPTAICPAFRSFPHYLS